MRGADAAQPLRVPRHLPQVGELRGPASLPAGGGNLGTGAVGAGGGVVVQGRDPWGHFEASEFEEKKLGGVPG